MGPCPVPPTDAGSSTISGNPPACTEQSQPPSQVATAGLVPSRSPDAPSVGVVLPGGGPVGVTRRPASEGCRPLGHLVHPDQPRPGEDLFQGLQPAAVVAEALPRRGGRFPGRDA